MADVTVNKHIQLGDAKVCINGKWFDAPALVIRPDPLEVVAERYLVGASGAAERVTATVREMGEAEMRDTLREHFGST